MRYHHGVPVYRYTPAAYRPPLSLSGPGSGGRGIETRRHIHDFPILLTNCSTAWLVAPGAVIDPSQPDVDDDCVAILFDTAAVDDQLSSPFRHNSPGGIARLDIPPQRRNHWEHILERIAGELARDDDHNRRASVAYLTILLTDIARLSSEVTHRPDDTVAAVFALIETRYSEPLTLADIGAHVSLTPAYLTTLIRKRTGKSVAQWIISRRLLEARRLLADTDESIATIARTVGFDDPAYFSRIFSREIGSSPRAWRRQEISPARH
ncbi:putative transcriptional regulator [Gordonia effusa NBRC 100432]|uniref:Putative transcriptional regulator n=1 Tax=Gordonia effusa NBRC 100432 TaxID=1077974 RepID=H0R0D1_9ACTN|nr:putative transcriptional regulator [Gordonia effusa NBRC 100432]